MVMWWFVMGYFIVLFAERAQSLIRSITDSEVEICKTGFSRYVNTICLLSLVAFLVLLFAINRDFLKALFVSGTAVDVKMLSITIGVILVSGMVHTEHTISGIQFGAYGLLIVALVIQTVKNNAVSGNPVMLWTSLVYLILFSMAIPVVYKSEMSNALIFHIVEAIVSLVLVAVFTFLMYKVFAGQAVDLFLVWPIVIAAIGDAAVIGLRWKEQVNTFVLIFVIASIIMWAVGLVTRLITK